jgi:Flp pilus assembly secretin CpaC
MKKVALFFSTIHLICSIMAATPDPLLVKRFTQALQESDAEWTEQKTIELLNDNVVLTGTVDTPLDAKRAVDLMKEEMDMLGAVRLREVEKAQHEIVAIARKLEEEGVIALGAGAGEAYVS